MRAFLLTLLLAAPLVGCGEASSPDRADAPAPDTTAGESVPAAPILADVDPASLDASRVVNVASNLLSPTAKAKFLEENARTQERDRALYMARQGKAILPFEEARQNMPALTFDASTMAARTSGRMMDPLMMVWDP